MQWKEKFGELVASRPLQYLVIGLAVAGVLYWYWFGRGKQSGKKSTVKFPTGSDTVSDTWATTQGRELVSNLYEAINGVSLDEGKKLGAASPLLAITDSQLRWVVTEYTHRYAENLINALDGEYFGTGGDIKAKVLYRLKNLQTAA